MRFLITGADKQTGNERTIEIEAENEQAAVTIAKTEGVRAYKVQQIAQDETRYDEPEPPPIIRDEVRPKIDRHSVNNPPSTAVWSAIFDTKKMSVWVWAAFATIALVVIALVGDFKRASDEIDNFDETINRAREKVRADSAARDKDRIAAIADGNGTARDESRASEIASIDSDLARDRVDDVRKDIREHPEYAELRAIDEVDELPTERTHSEELLAAIRTQKESESVPSLISIPHPKAQEQFCEVMNQAGIILATKTTNELQQNELEQNLEKLRQAISQRVEFQRWLVQVTRIEVVDAGVIKRLSNSTEAMGVSGVLCANSVVMTLI